MKAMLVLLELNAMLVLPGFVLAQAARPPDGSVTCAPLAITPAPPGSNYATSSAMAAMCTAVDPMTWQSKTIGNNNDQNPLVGPDDDRLLIEHRHDGAGDGSSARDALGFNRRLGKIRYHDTRNNGERR